MLAARISNLKNELVSPDQAISDAGTTRNPFDDVVARVYAEYQGRLRAANAVDFDDLIGEVVRTSRIYRKWPSTIGVGSAMCLSTNIRILNHAQYVLVSRLVGTPVVRSAPVSCASCYLDQSIYAFRGATIRNIEEFEKDYPNATSILFCKQNYRSTRLFLSAANALIARNENRREKKLWTDLGDGGQIKGYVADNEHDEARFIANEIDSLVDSGDFHYSDIAVFYRTNNSSRALEEVFIRMGVPYNVVGGTRFISAARFAMLSPICALSKTSTTMFPSAALLTRRAGASVIELILRSHLRRR